ncbi:MAG: hypothetical protein JWO83_2515 [Caulobacteraceae bacterium]|jgi:hypothetical protein|nr:hypothetical protein [Caulobacteraceae bacterium]
MSQNASSANRAPAKRAATRAYAQSHRFNSDVFSTALFTGLNVAVFLVLAASVAAAALLYSQGA